MVSEVTIYFERTEMPARLLNKPVSPLKLHSMEGGFFLFISPEPRAPAFFLQEFEPELLSYDVHVKARELLGFTPANDLYYKRDRALTAPVRRIVLDVLAYLHDRKVAYYLTAMGNDREFLVYGENRQKRRRYVHPGFAPLLDEMLC